MPKTAPELLHESWPSGPGRPSNLHKTLRALYSRVELGDAVLLLYVMAFIRQYLWLVGNNKLAWSFTLLLSLLVWYFHLTTKRREPDADRIPPVFWPVVALPLFVVYAMRVAFPDGSFDQLNYHLLSSVRALRGLPFMSGDFFPAPFQLNPAPDMVTGISRYLLGYRLGTIINYFAMVWSGTILYKLLRDYVGSKLLRCLGVLLIVFTEQALFEINNYMVDLLAVPLLLEATYLILNTEEANERREVVRVAVLLGASVAFKLTNLALVLPLVMVYGYRLLRSHALRRKDPLLFVIGFLAPLLPFSAFMYWQTRNPVFPFYNKIFRSPYWPLINWVDVRWGPKAVWEALVWPIFIFLRPERTSELAVYSGRLCITFAAVILCLLIKPAGKNMRTLCVIILLGLGLWTLSTGYVRYATYLELLGGVAILGLTYHLSLKAADFPRAIKRLLTVLPWAILVVQACIAGGYIYRYEWSMRRTVFDNRAAFATESKNLLRDHSFMKFVPARERKLFDDVDVWVESNFITNGVETLARDDVPIILVCFPYYFETPGGLERFSRTLDAAAGKRMYSLVFTKDLSPSLDMLYFRGLEMGRFTPVSIPYYSQNNRFDMVMIEILPPGKGVSRENIKTTRATSPQPASAFKANIHLDDTPPLSIKAGEKATIYFRVRNVSDVTWPALGRTDGAYSIRLGDHWLNNKNTMVVQDDGRASLIYDLQPGNEIDLPLTVTAPGEPGQYTLQIDMVQELVDWYGSRGSNTLRLEMKVER